MTRSDGERRDSPRRFDPGEFAARLVATLQNGLEVARFGGLGDKAEPSPYEVVESGDHHRLRHYFPESGARGRPAALLVPPLMMSAEVWDVAPESSAVVALHKGGADSWVVDFGSPEQETGGLHRTLTDHVLAVSTAIGTVQAATGRDVHVMGYSQGGMFAYQAAAYRQSEGIASLVGFGSPVDMHGQFDLPAEIIASAVEGMGKLQEALLPDGIPSWATRLGFQLMDPVNTIRQRIDFAMKLYDREALQPREGMRRFLESEAWTAFPGPALRDVMEQLVAHNRMLQGGFVIDDRPVTLADIVCPILVFVGETDSIAPPPAVRAIRAAAPRADSYQIKIPAGHFGLVVGSRSMEITWPSVLEWLEHHERGTALPERATALVAGERDGADSAGGLDRFGRQAELAWNVGRDMLADAANLFEDRIGILGRLSRTIAPQLPRLSRLAELRSDTPINMGLTLEERAREAPSDTFFLFEGRAHDYQAANERVDNIVRGFVKCGVRHGEYVGVLMETRPSAVASTVALNRLGAIPVLLRPDAPLQAQLNVAPIDHLLADPEHSEAALGVYGDGVLVLGGGGDARTLASGLIDMEAIDPEQVELPDWFAPNSGVAGEVALVLIAGDGNHLAPARVTNRRWATSGFGTATACALGSGDTVYCCSPIHHATGILVCVAGALVSGARLAMATHFEPEVFWDDVRRYGVSVVFYTGSLCRELVNAAENRAEQHHPIRLFAGSGMPRGTWERVSHRFSPAQVVEFFASTEGNAVLVNLTGEKVGSVGRPLPGGADLAIAAWDLEASRFLEQDNGFARRCRHGEVGLLLAEYDSDRGEVATRPLRGVFDPADAWINTGDLVWRDEDGDYWLADTVSNLIHGAERAIPTIPIEDELTSRLPFSDLIAVYGVTPPGSDEEVPVAALTLRPGTVFDATAMREIVEAALPPDERPVAVRVLDALPLTAGHRVQKRVLRAARLGSASEQASTFWLARDEKAYVTVLGGEAEGFVTVAGE